MIGAIAAILTTFSFLPQVIKTIKTKDTQGISLVMYLMQTTGIFLWGVHGYLIKDNALFYANLVTFLLASIVLYYKITEQKRSSR
ncbi:MAG: SemiSWEET transporter [Lactovum sp.]